MSEFACPHEDCKDETFDTERAMKIHYATVHDGSLAKKETECSVRGCNNKFEYYPSEKSGDLCRSCVKEEDYHLTEDKVEYYTVQCENCEDKKEVTESKFNHHNFHFCDEECRYEYQTNRKDMICDNCLEEKSVQAFRVKHSGENIYCSRKCYVESITQGEFDNGWYYPSFKQVRSKVRERDNYECQICGKHKEELGENPSAHHITPVRWFFKHEYFSVDDANYTENMVLLCRHHHTLVDYDKINMREKIDDGLLEKLELEPPAES